MLCLSQEHSGNTFRVFCQKLELEIFSLFSDKNISMLGLYTKDVLRSEHTFNRTWNRCPSLRLTLKITGSFVQQQYDLIVWGIIFSH